MLEKIKSKLSNPEFQRNAAQVGGQVVGMIASVVISNLVSKAMTIGVDALMDKIHNVQSAE